MWEWKEHGRKHVSDAPPAGQDVGRYGCGLNVVEIEFDLAVAKIFFQVEGG